MNIDMEIGLASNQVSIKETALPYIKYAEVQTKDK